MSSRIQAAWEQLIDDPLPLAMRVAQAAWTWRDDRKIRHVFAEGIQLAAGRIEFNLPKIVGRSETPVRTSLRHTSGQIGATLRSYAADVILGGVERDQAIADKMSSALVSAAWGRWENLATHEPAPPVERFLKRFGPRIAVAGILVTAAILLPVWLHEWIGDSSAQFRIALIAAAATRTD